MPAIRSPNAYQPICILGCFNGGGSRGDQFMFLMGRYIAYLFQYLVRHFHSPEAIYHTYRRIGII